MNPLHRFIRPLRSLFGKSKLEQDTAEELRFHLGQRAADRQADGLSPEEARYAAERKFGNVASLQEQAREDRGWLWLETLVKDLRFAARQLARSPGFTLLAIVTLGLGIGANTSMFSVLNGILLKPLPFAQVDQLERIYRATAQNPEGNLSAADFLALRKGRQDYGAVFAFPPSSASLSEPQQPAEMAYSPLILAGTTVLLVTVALPACCLPARRAAKIDAIATLRAD
jgi:hypothetical protein